MSDTGERTAPSEQEYESAYATWRASLTTLLGDSSRLARWQERRYQFAHRVGALLTGAHAGSAAVRGRRRQTGGDWQPRDLARSRSRGALHAERLPQLGRLVLEAWAELSGTTAPEHASLTATSVGRAVFPSALHEPWKRPAPSPRSPSAAGRE